MAAVQEIQPIRAGLAGEALVPYSSAADIAVAERYCEERGIPHIVAYLEREALVSVLADVVYGTEFFEAIDAMDSVVAYLAYRAVARHGFKVALCGEGSDEVLAGYDLFRDHDDPDELMPYRVHNLHRTDLQRVDRSSMLNTVKTRVPSLDRDLLTFAYRLPMHFKLRGDCPKWVLREAFRDSLPGYIVDLPKIRMPDGGSGLKNTLVDHARQFDDLDRGRQRRSVSTRRRASTSSSAISRPVTRCRRSASSAPAMLLAQRLLRVHLMMAGAGGPTRRTP